jgi:glutathione S-transferase
MGDSAIILKHLIETNAAADLNADLSAAERGQDLAIRALLEDKLYFYHGRERWVNNYYVMRDHTLGSIPYPMRIIVGLLAYRGNVRKLYDQGAGRFNDAETLGFKTEIWEGINGILVESKSKSNAGEGQECFWVLGGAQPTEADAVLFGFVVSVLVCDAGPESRKLVKGFPAVVEYAERIHGRWFPDYELWP